MQLSAEEQYLSVLKELVELNDVSPDRTGTGRIRVFDRSIKVDVSDGTVPLITTRKINQEHGIEELLWMIKGSTNINELADSTKVIWKDWAIKEEHIDRFISKFCKEIPEESVGYVKQQLTDRYLNSIGPMYGHFWRNNESTQETTFLPFDSVLIDDIPSDKKKKYSETYDEMVFFAQQATLSQGQTLDIEQLPEKDLWIKEQYINSNDQLGEIIRGLKRRPFSARHVLSSWIPQALPFESVMTPHENVLIGRGALAPCHILTGFFVEKATDGGPNYLNLHQTQRSCDWVLGVCTNILEYSVLLHLVAHCTNLRPKILSWNGIDCHLYANHVEGAKEQLTRSLFPSAKIKINPDQRDLFAMTRSDIEIVDYQHHPFIKFPVSV